jgi:hypothetical protein
MLILHNCYYYTLTNVYNVHIHSYCDGIWQCARQRFGKHSLKVGIVEPDTELFICWATVHAHFRDDTFMKNSNGTLGGGDLYSVLSVIKVRSFVNWRDYSVNGGIIGKTCSWGIYIREPNPPGWKSLESETVKCGHESRGTRASKRLLWRGPALIVKNKPIFSLERVLHKDYMFS